jgi:hypothetical protein
VISSSSTAAPTSRSPTELVVAHDHAASRRRAFCTDGSAPFARANTRARTSTLAGLAAIVISSPVAGLRPGRFFCAGLTLTVSCTSPPIRTFCAFPSDGFERIEHALGVGLRDLGAVGDSGEQLRLGQRHGDPSLSRESTVIGRVFDRAPQVPCVVIVAAIARAGHARTCDVSLGFRARSRFPCPQCGRACQAVEFTEGSLRQPDVAAFEAFVTARLPSIRCPEHGDIALTPSWASDHVFASSPDPGWKHRPARRHVRSPQLASGVRAIHLGAPGEPAGELVAHVPITIMVRT